MSDKKYIAFIVGGPHSAIDTHQAAHLWAAKQFGGNPKYKQVYVAEVIEVAEPVLEVPVTLKQYAVPVEPAKVIPEEVGVVEKKGRLSQLVNGSSSSPVEAGL